MKKYFVLEFRANISFTFDAAFGRDFQMSAIDPLGARTSRPRSD